MKVLQISKQGLPTEVMELVDISEPDAPKAGGLLAAVEYAPITSIYGAWGCARSRQRLSRAMAVCSGPNCPSRNRRRAGGWFASRPPASLPTIITSCLADDP